MCLFTHPRTCERGSSLLSVMTRINWESTTRSYFPIITSVKDLSLKRPFTLEFQKFYSNLCFYQLWALAITGSNLFSLLVVRRLLLIIFRVSICGPKIATQVKNTLPCNIPVRSILLYPLIILIDRYSRFFRIELILLLSGNELTDLCWSILILHGMYLGGAPVYTCSSLSFLLCEGGGNLVWLSPMIYSPSAQ